MIGDTIIFEKDGEKIKQYPNEDHDFSFTELLLDSLNGLGFSEMIDIPVTFTETISYDENLGYYLGKINPKALEYIFEKYPVLAELKSADELDEEDDLYELANYEIEDLIKLKKFTNKFGLADLYLYSTF